MLLSQLEAALEKKPINCKVRKNKDKVSKKLELRPDSSANDYRFCSYKLENYCYYELIMDFEKNYNTYPEVVEMIKVYNMGGGTSNYKMNKLEPNDLKKRHYPTG